MGERDDVGVESAREPEREIVLVLCRANVARSPLTAAMLRQRLAQIHRDDLVVSSAGLDAGFGDPAAPEGVQVAKERGLDLSDHQSTGVSKAALSAASLVLTMTEADRSAVLRLSPGAISRTFTLPELVRLLSTDASPVQSCAELSQRAHRARPRTPPAEAPEDITDPIGRTQRHYERMADRVAGLVEEVAAHLLPGGA